MTLVCQIFVFFAYRKSYAKTNFRMEVYSGGGLIVTKVVCFLLFCLQSKEVILYSYFPVGTFLNNVLFCNYGGDVIWDFLHLCWIMTISRNFHPPPPIPNPLFMWFLEFSNPLLIRTPAHSGPMSVILEYYTGPLFRYFQHLNPFLNISCAFFLSWLRMYFF